MPVDSRNRPWSVGGGGAIVVSRLSPQKRVSLAIETVAFLASCGHEMPLTIVGDGPERAALERLVEKLGITSFVTLHRRRPLRAKSRTTSPRPTS